MPHLAPTSWSAALISFWLILLTLNTLIWWLQLPKFPSLTSHSSSLPSSTWPWK